MSMRVLIADDSALFRRVISETLRSMPEVEIVGSVSTGVSAVQKAKELHPDLITLDMEMPGMNGLEVLDALKSESLNTNVILVSALTLQGGALTLQALAKGAFDFITKPDTGDFEQNLKLIHAELVPRIRALRQRLEVRGILRCGGVSQKDILTAPRARQSFPVRPSGALDASALSPRTSLAKPEILLIGVSTGGPNALQRLFSTLPSNLGVPIAVVQHMPPLFTHTLAQNISNCSALNACEAADGDLLSANRIYIAPGGRHMQLIPGPNRQKKVQITDDPPENNCRPAVDYLFRSVAKHFPGEALAVILTGMGNDGTIGLRLLKQHGCRVVAQDEASCVVFGMPKAAIEAGVVDTVLPIDEIATHITSVMRGVTL